MNDRTADDALLALAFSIKSNPGAYALLIGAGVSAGSGIPTAWRVLEDLTGRVAELAGDDVQDSLAWYQTTYGEAPRYETLLEKVAPTPLERQRLLRDYFEPSADDVESARRIPTPAHDAIARMVQTGSVRVIVTLNFDRLIEQALRAAGIEPTVITSPADVVGMAPLHTIDCCVIHLHGDYLNATSMRNTTSELESYDPATLSLLQQVLRDYGLIIAGWSSIYDPVLRDAIAEQYPARLKLAWIEPGPVSDLAADLRTLKKGLLIESTADDAFGRLADAVEALRVRNAGHPLTIAAAVETAKRELSGRTVAIGLHDTLNREFARLHEHPDFHLPSLQDDQAYGGYTAVLGRVEGASRLACALVATVTYWGNKDTDQWWVDEVHRFTLRPRASGLVRLVNIRLVTGSMLFYSSGVSAVAARRFDVLAKLLAASAADPFRGRQVPVGDILDPARVYELTNAAPRFYSLGSALLREALAVNDEALDEAWQRFEILRLVATTMRDSRFHEHFQAFAVAEDALSVAQEAFEAAERSGDDVDASRRARADAVRDRGLQLGGLADLVHLGSPHLLAVSYYSADGHRNPVAERLAEDVLTEGTYHPLVAARIAEDPAALRAGLLAVSVAIGRRGHEMALQRISGNAGIVADEIWIDTGKTPSELRQASSG